MKLIREHSEHSTLIFTVLNATLTFGDSQVELGLWYVWTNCLARARQQNFEVHYSDSRIVPIVPTFVSGSFVVHVFW